MDGITRARAVLAHGRGSGAPEAIRDDLVRAALVMGVAALDTYLHAAVMKSVQPWTATAALAKQPIRFDEVISLVAEACELDRPWVRVKEVLRARLMRIPMQGPEAVESALRMCGVSKPWTKIARERHISQASLRSRLGQIVHRRNKVVHEGDLMRFARPQSVIHEHVDPARVARDINWLGRLIDSIDRIVP